MITDFKLPAVGENITSGTIVKVNVAVGASVKKDQSLLELETDKATIEVPAPSDGTIKEILIKEGQQVNIGQVVMKIESSATAAPKAAPKAAEALAAAEKPARRAGRRVVETERVSVKPMSIAEAILQLQRAKRGFFLFRNSANELVSVIYRRKDGELGLVEPEVS